MRNAPSPSPRGTPESRIALYSEALVGLLEDKFFDVAFGNPDPQPYRLGWFTEDAPKLDLYFGPSLPEEEIKKLGCDRRDVEVQARVFTDDARKLTGLRAIRESELFEGFDVETSEEGGTVFHDVFFRVPRPHTANRVRNTLVRFAAALEKAGFRNTRPLEFDWMAEVDLGSLDFAEHDASVQVMRMEAEEEAHGPNVDVTQAKQAIDRILEGKGREPKK